MSKWFYINIFIFVFAIYSIWSSYHGIHMIIGGIGLAFVLYNWTRHAVFATIRTSKNRKQTVMLAQFSKKVLPLHKWTGTTALILILVHGYFVIRHYGLLLTYPKMISGLIAGGTLLFMVITGWLRWYRTTVFRRYLHWVIGFILVFTIVIHLFF